MIRHKPITVVGAGQLGSALACRLLEQGHTVRVVDARCKTNVHVKQHQQIPWGWYRKISLQSSLKRRLTTSEFPFPPFLEACNATYGPMIISSRNNSVLQQWKAWIDGMGSQTSARVLKPAHAQWEFGFHKEYFGESSSGGVFVCDERDFMLDFGALNECLWDYLDAHPHCEWIDDCTVHSLTSTNDQTATLHTSQGPLQCSSAVLAIGNQTANLVPSLPIFNIQLPYVVLQSKYTQHPYISLWNKQSSILYFQDGTVKVACGMQSLIDIEDVRWRTLHHFLPMGVQGVSNMNLFFRDFAHTPEMLIQKAVEELQNIGVSDTHLLHHLSCVEHCSVDVTPNLCPYIGFLSHAPSVLCVSGFSGSGTLCLDNTFLDVLSHSIREGTVHSALAPMDPRSQSLWDHWHPPDQTRTALSSII